MSKMNRDTDKSEFRNGNSRNQSEASPKKRIIFEYPALSVWETSYYFIVIACACSFGWYRVYETSRNYKWDGGWGNYEYGNIPFLGRRKKDVTNYEWRMFVPYMIRVVPWLIGHSFLFNLSEKVLPYTAWSMGMLFYWLFASYNLFHGTIVALAVGGGILVYSVMRLTKSKLAIWAVCGVFLYMVLNNPVQLPHPINHYSTVAFLCYKLLQYITFTIEECDNGRLENKNFMKGLYNMFWYAFYFPYLTALIVIYRDFPSELNNRHRQKMNWKATIFYGLRVIFWYIFLELFMYAMHFNAILADPEFLATIRKDALVSMGYAGGAFFQMKYVIIFGVPAFFAKLDNMSPPKGPICISRVMLYSKVWRNFDRGLYRFFKEYIFLPICRPTFSISRKIFGIFVSYGFVLLWHGLIHNFIVWIVLNIAELFIEIIAKVIYQIPVVKQWREAHISDRMFRRFLCLLHTCPFAFGLYAIFYFLTDSESGYVFVERIFWQETVPVKWPFLLLIFLGYHLANVCVDIERWLNAREAKSHVKID